MSSLVDIFIRHTSGFPPILYLKRSGLVGISIAPSKVMSSVGQIAYGTVPPGFSQDTPANGPPPPLVPLEPGKYYVFYLLTMGAPHVMGAFEMKDGKTSRVYGLPFCVEFNEKGEGVWTRCRGDENPAK